MKLESLQAVSLGIAEELSVEIVLKRIVEGLVAQPGVALARLWLRGPGDICAKCPMRLECPDQRECLHLMASAGKPTKIIVEDWSRLDGDFRRFPFNVRKIGKIGATGEPLLLTNLRAESDWIARPHWAEREGLQSFAGQPLIFRGEVLGVLAIFSRRMIAIDEFAWLRMFADHAAVAIANSRAFAEIEQLRERLRLENAYLREEVKQERSFGDIVGESAAFKKVLEQIALVAQSEANVLILGESGTGKELIARAIHERSQRAAGPLVKVNCASIPRELFESEFFGHVRGAFTGAIRDRVGRFQLADGGTLFLDEVGEIPLDLQSKLLRVLQEGAFERVGEEKTRRTNVRILAATNRDLRRGIEAGLFRQDLFFRLSVFPIELPPLRERREDIPLLVRHFIQEARRQARCGRLQVSDEQMAALTGYHWPGNVRELQNVIERAMILSRCGAQPLKFDLILPEAEPAPARQPTNEPPAAAAFVTQSEWKAQERANLLAALEAANWKIYGSGGAARLLGMKATTLASRLQSLGIKKMRG
ncbi:MAG: sigma 54-interacting transcriptional regulator [Acidobacteria bacterium]|nr:sigma 54-interacting transcriptional regulator [Acidobacteriota bacterium]MCW5970703.1 sigma 54-interacting transcriptional regulator [Blastocatellales bacterium]